MVSRLFGSGDPFNLLHREVNRVFDEVVRGLPSMRGGFAPDLDVHETATGIEVTAELPGLSEEDIDLRLDGDMLTLSGEKKDQRQSGQGGTHMTERSFGRFQRSFRLPFTPDQDQVQARFDRGVLHVEIPRPAQQHAGGRIRIHAAQGGAGGGAGGTGGAHVEPAGGHATLTATGGDSTGTSSGVQAPHGGTTQGMVPERKSDQAPGTPSRQSRDAVEEASRESFPASDPPANTGITGTVSRT